MIDASPATILLALALSPVRGHRRATAVGWRNRLEPDPRRGRRRRRWRLREPQEALSAATIALEISSRNARVAALQTLGPAARRP